MADQFTTKCIECNKERILTRTMIYHIRSGRCKNRCLSCASLGNKNRFFGKIYETSKYYESPTYRTWSNMKTRCTNKKSPEYLRYGKRGITMCRRWEEFSNFLEDMGERPEGKTIERIDNNKGYELSNCKWATPQEQANNRRSNRLFTVGGEIKTLTQWIRYYKLKDSTVRQRVYSYGWDIERALELY